MVLKKYDAIYNRIRYLIILKGSASYVVLHNYGKIKIDSDDDMLLKNMLIKCLFQKQLRQRIVLSIWYLNDTLRPLVLILLKMSGYIKNLGIINNKLR